MCGRFTQHYTWAELHALYSLNSATPRNLQARYNIAPTTSVQFIRPAADGGLELVSARWWLVPGWWNKPLKAVPATFNARVETVATGPMFRSAFKSKRCIIPASGFFEWTGDKADKQPHLFTSADGAPILSFAGLWESWKNPEDGEHLLSCTIITAAASPWMGPYHDRMPALIAANDHEAWLMGKLGVDALKPAPQDALREWKVSKRVNKTGVGDDDPTILDPVEH